MSPGLETRDNRSNIVTVNVEHITPQSSPGFQDPTRQNACPNNEANEVVEEMAQVSPGLETDALDNTIEQNSDDSKYQAFWFRIFGF